MAKEVWIESQGDTANFMADVRRCLNCTEDANCPINKFKEAIQAQKGRTKIDDAAAAKTAGVKMIQPKDFSIVLSGPEMGPHLTFHCPDGQGSVEIYAQAKVTNA